MLTGETLPLERLRGAFIGSICGIAAPESFEDGLRKLGARIELAKRYIDHHRYTEAELQTFINRCIRRDLEMIVTTEKDAVRFPRLQDGGAGLFSSGGNRNHQRTGDVGTLRRPNLSATADAVAGKILCLAGEFAATDLPRCA